MSEIEVRREAPASLDVQMNYARAVASGSMLPDQYRNNPANVLIAVGLGQSMGLSPAESLYRIAVIKGKPTASAELIASNVRKAGHKLRVATDDLAQSVTATIIRADDPEFPFTVTRDMEWAQQMGLASNDNYRKQGVTMLQWRAITAVARLACPETLYGVQYAPDELDDFSAARPATTVAEQVTPKPSGAEAPPPNEGATAPTAGSSGGNDESGPSTSAPESPLLNPSGALAKRMFATMHDAGIPSDREARLAYVSTVLGRDVASSKEMTDADAEAVIAATEAALAQPFDEPVDGEVVE